MTPENKSSKVKNDQDLLRAHRVSIIFLELLKRAEENPNNLELHNLVRAVSFLLEKTDLSLQLFFERYSTLEADKKLISSPTSDLITSIVTLLVHDSEREATKNELRELIAKIYEQIRSAQTKEGAVPIQTPESFNLVKKRH